MDAYLNSNMDLVEDDLHKEITTLRQQLAESQARVALLEDLADDALRIAENEFGMDYTSPHTQVAMEAFMEFGRKALSVEEHGDFESAFLLRVQAEAVEAAWHGYSRESSEEDCKVLYLDDMEDCVRSLCQQADAIEAGGGR